MLFEIQSHRGAGSVQFGMSPDEARAALASEFESFKRSQESAYPCDHFTALGCFVYYGDESGLVEAVEFAAPAEPMFDGLNLLGLGFADLHKQITKIDPDVLLDADGLTSLRLGIGAWAPFLEEEPDTPPEAVIAFAPGYYD